MVNKRFLQTAERWKNPSLPVEKAQPVRPAIPTSQPNNFPANPDNSFLFSYDGEHGQFFQELIAKVNERFSGTKAELPIETSGEVQNMYVIKRMALVSTIANNLSLQSQGFYPITATQSEHLLQAGKLTNPGGYWEDLALLLYDTKGNNPKEAQALKESIIQHRTDLGLSQNDLEKRLVIVNAGGEPDQNMDYGVKPIIIPGITQVYQHEILDKTGEDHTFEYGLDGGLPVVSEIGNGNRTLYMPSGNNLGLRVLYRNRVLDLNAGGRNLANSVSLGRVNFVRSAST